MVDLRLPVTRVLGQFESVLDELSTSPLQFGSPAPVLAADITTASHFINAMLKL